jgi:flagellar biosynthesis GTPase FlhF
MQARVQAAAKAKAAAEKAAAQAAEKAAAEKAAAEKAAAEKAAAEKAAAEKAAAEKAAAQAAAQAAAEKAKAAAEKAKAADNTTIMSVSGIAGLINKINATFTNLLPKIENRLKKNDMIPQLKKLTQFLSEINDSLPEPTYGGGTRRSRMKKGKKTLRNRKNL